MVEAMEELGKSQEDDAPIPPEAKGKDDKAKKSDKKADKKADKAAAAATQAADSGPGEGAIWYLGGPGLIVVDSYHNGTCVGIGSGG